MEFAFSGDSPVGSECRRVLMEEVEGAVSQLADFHENPDLAIHETRKHNKRMRAVLLLARPVLDSGDISKANRLIRDAARLFSEARDALVLQETCDKLADYFGMGESDKAFDRIKSRLAKRHDKILKDKSLHQRVTEASDDFLEAGRLLERWSWDRVTFAEVFSAVVSNYRLGFDDYEKARVSRDPEECHDWRKRAKSLSYHLTLLTFLDPREIGDWAVGAGELASCLGEHHDIAVFEEALDDGSDYGISAGAARAIIALAEQRRTELEDSAFAQGAVIYSETPEALHRKFAWLAGAYA